MENSSAPQARIKPDVPKKDFDPLRAYGNRVTSSGVDESGNRYSVITPDNLQGIRENNQRLELRQATQALVGFANAYLPEDFKLQGRVEGTLRTDTDDSWELLTRLTPSEKLLKEIYEGVKPMDKERKEFNLGTEPVSWYKRDFAGRIIVVRDTAYERRQEDYFKNNISALYIGSCKDPDGFPYLYRLDLNTYLPNERANSQHVYRYESDISDPKTRERSKRNFIRPMLGSIVHRGPNELEYVEIQVWSPKSS